MTDSGIDYFEEMKRYCISRGIWDFKNQKPTRYVINKLKSKQVKHPDGYTYTQQEFDGFTTKRHKYTKCRRCFKYLTGHQRSFCSESCRVDHNKLKKKFEELRKDDPTIEGIWIKHDSDGKPQWKNIEGTFRGKKGELITKKGVITKKSGKPRNKDLKRF